MGHRPERDGNDMKNCTKEWNQLQWLNFLMRPRIFKSMKGRMCGVKLDSEGWRAQSLRKKKVIEFTSFYLTTIRRQLTEFFDVEKVLGGILRTRICFQCV